ncbi:MAG: glycosyltransferase [Desulfobacca sp. 4484_104]|nr:MAG: glycosyltransferase [Desulfobacca sp. 4484_104]
MEGQVRPVPSRPEDSPYISVVIPVYNEEDNLPQLVRRLVQTLTATGRTFEILMVDDGSQDRSWEILTELYEQHPEHLRAIQFNRNFGQHRAIFAGFQAARGQVVVTLDADLQNPPEEIPRLVAKLEEGYDTVGGWRETRHDSIFRKRQEGKSKYGIRKLIRLNFDLMTGFSHFPIHVVGFLGLLIALAGLGFGIFLFIRRLVVGPEVEGVFTLFAILFVFSGLQMFGLALIGEYVGRIYREVRQRPRYVIRQQLGGDSD